MKQKLITSKNTKLKKLFSELIEGLKKIYKDKLVRIILYGSYARNEQNGESDIDIMVLLKEDDNSIKKNKDNIVDLEVKILLSYDIELSILARNINKFKNYTEFIPFYENVLNEGKNIYG